MKIAKVLIKNYRCLQQATVKLNPHLNVVVGDNECGKSTFLEAVHLALSGQLNGRQIQAELHPFLFTSAVTTKYLSDLRSGKSPAPPEILIELYFSDETSLAKFKGRNNSLKENVPGVKMLIEFNEDYRSEYDAYIATPSLIRTIPVEYYMIRWRDFADNDLTARSVPIKPCFVDASTIRNNLAASRYILDVVKDSLSKKQQVDLSLSYRLMKDKFLADDKVAAINKSLDAKKGVLSQKTLSISLDTSSRSGWEVSVIPHLDDIPMPLVGKGEQNSVKIKLAMEASAESHIFLIEEAENHLSFSNLNILIQHISDTRKDRQLLITTHSSFVLNKLGVESVLLFRNGRAINLETLDDSTRDYFMKLPGYDTLRLILSKRSVLVEGPSDELVVQKAFLMKYGKMPIEMGVDVISVSSLAFRRFLEIAKLLDIEVDVLTDNDGDKAAVEARYASYESERIGIWCSEEEAGRTLEPQLLHENGREALNNILGKSFETDEALLDFMSRNKTDCALKLFETDVPWKVPKYINYAVDG